MIRAIHFENRTEHRLCKLAGSVWLSDPGDDGVSALWFFCPCGCERLSRITVGVEHKPKMAGASWRWNGSTDAPTLKPSVNQLVCGWHGWLRDGYWEVA